MHAAKNILIIEDDKSIREMMKSVLEIEGYGVMAAENGHQGIMALGNMPPPDVILLDMMMPVMNGWDFMDFLKTNSAGAQIPIIIVSAFAETARSVKPQAVVNKPVQLKELLTAIEKLT